MVRAPKNKEALKETWNRHMTGVVPMLPGNYWIFVERWRLTQVSKDEYGKLRSSWPPMRVDQIHPDRWGPLFR